MTTCKIIPDNIILMQFLINQIFIAVTCMILFSKCNKKFTFFYYFINVIIIFYYQIFKSKYLYEDPLLIQYKIWDVDGWSMTHFLFNIILGFHCGFNKTNILRIIFFGILWEIFEHIYGQTNEKLISYFYKKKEKIEKEYWWYGKVSDIIINILGLFIGILFKKINLHNIIYQLNGRISKI